MSFSKAKTKAEAKELGLTVYFTGKPCKHGHLANKLIHNGGCSECHRIKGAAHREANRERIRKQHREYQSKYQKKNPEVKRKAQSLRRARARNAEGSFTVQEIKELYELQNHQCSICKCSLEEVGYQIDHKTPLSRGGSNWISNIQLLCPRDNRYKNALTHEEYLLKLGITS